MPAQALLESTYCQQEKQPPAEHVVASESSVAHRQRWRAQQRSRVQHSMHGVCRRSICHAAMGVQMLCGCPVNGCSIGMCQRSSWLTAQVGLGGTSSCYALARAAFCRCVQLYVVAPQVAADVIYNSLHICLAQVW